ncbi:hypothetical protein PLESTF_001244500 [Pleodorina starrii]|nr:hypothetical protein PLESTF_001244500 [Pleodorina starrii]
MEALTEQGLVAEVTTGTFSFKNKISASCIKTLWEKLSRFVADALKQQKGVLLPNLGTFSVGPVVGEARKKVRPAFTLLDTRYSGISQERPKYTIGGRCAVVQPNYGLLATAAAVHRGTCQRLVVELMQRLGVHILSGRPILVAFPGVGRLLTNRAGRIQFEFDTLLREFFELERERVIPEMERGGAGAAEADENVAHVVKGLQQVHLHNPPAIKNRPVSDGPGASPASPSARVKRNAHAPYKGELLDLWRLCKTNDRISSGCVPRLQLEQWLAKECPQVLRQVAAATVLQLLSTHTYGKTGKHIIYKPFLDQLEMAVEREEVSPRRAHSPRVVEVRIDSPSGALRRRQQEQQQEPAGDGEEEEVIEVTLSPVQRGHDAQQGQSPSPLQPPSAQFGQPPPYWQQPAQQQYPPPGVHPSPQQYSHAPQQYTPQGQYLSPQGQYLSPQGQYLQQGMYTPQGGGHNPHQGQYQQQGLPAQPQGQQLHSARAQPPPSSQRPVYTPQAPPMQAWQQQGQGSDSKPYHYYQNQLSPRSRREFDNFNRLHFEKLEQVRGANYKLRAVTPKVGEDELNRQEYHAIRQGGDGATPAQVLRLQVDAPYTRDTPHPIVSAQRRRGSPGPKSQILTLAHEPQYLHVPGLPTHQYQLLQQQQQHPMTPQQLHGARQPTPQQRPHSAQQPTPAADESPPISQYEIINESDPYKRQQKRNELASALNRNWSEQIREKEALLENLAEAQTQWPYVPTHRPNDKRPADAVSRPLSAWGPS